MQQNIVDAVVDLQHEIGFGNAEKGFHDQGVEILSYYNAAQAFSAEAGLGTFASEEAKAAYIRDAERDHAAYCAQRLLLVVTEIAEAFEEVRSGRSMTEVWYSNKQWPGVALVMGEDGNYYTRDGGVRNGNAGWAGFKPEGVPSELADILIRVLDIGDEFGINLGAVVQEKLAYNATREKMHGRKL